MVKDDEVFNWFSFDIDLKMTIIWPGRPNIYRRKKGERGERDRERGRGGRERGERRKERGLGREIKPRETETRKESIEMGW